MAKSTDIFHLVEPKKNSVRYKGKGDFDGMSIYLPNRLLTDPSNPPQTIEVTVKT